MRFYKLFLFVFILPVSALLQSCGTQPLPEKRPEDMRITYIEDGGMLDKGKTIYISRDSSYVTSRENGAKNKIYMIFRNAELDSLYNTFRKNNFAEISVYEESEVYDRGGSSISMRWGEEKITKSNTGTSFVTEGSQAEYENIKEAITLLSESFLKQLERDFVIELDTTITSANVTVNINIDNGWSYSSKESGMRDTVITNIFSGEHSISLVITREEPGSGKTKAVASESFRVDVKPHTSGLRFYLEDGKIRMKEINIL